LREQDGDPDRHRLQRRAEMALECPTVALKYRHQEREKDFPNDEAIPRERDPLGRCRLLFHGSYLSTALMQHEE
jgi:hypothetical protein